MNLVKGVADLLRRSAGGQGEGPPWGRGDRLSASSPKIRFGEAGEEAVLNSLWQRYENTIDKIEKRKLLQVFLMHFIQTYKNWKPVNNYQLPASSASFNLGNNSKFEDAIMGCSSGHPAEVVLILTQEIARITSLVNEFNSSGSLANAGLSDASLSFNFSSEALHVLNSLTIMTRSLHNCRTFCYYGGVQKVTALLKATVIQLKTLSAGVAMDDNLSKDDAGKIELLENILLYVVSIIFLFMDLDPDVHEKTEYILSTISSSKDARFWIPHFVSKEAATEVRIQWQQRAVILVMEAGGLNWLVELLRVMRRLNMKDQWSQLSLQYLTLSTVKSALYQNPRSQNHFRSIGGIEVLLDQLGFPSSGYLVSKISSSETSLRTERDLFSAFHLQVVYLEVLRESIFGNLSNLQFLCENGRIQKFANNICSPAFMLQEFQQHRITYSKSSNSDWMEYCAQLSSVLCSFFVSLEDMNNRDAPPPGLNSPMPASFSYSELSVKWIMKVLLAIFPCIKACSGENEAPIHLRTLANILQHHTLSAFRKFLILSPKLLEVFREEGLWDFIFSDKFFYMKLGSEEHYIHSNNDDQPTSSSTNIKNQATNNEIDILQMEAVSFVEFAATLTGIAHNMPECSILLETLEKSCNPEISNVIIKSLNRILQLTVEQTTATFAAVNAVGRVLNVACTLAKECMKKTVLIQDKEKKFDSELQPSHHDSGSSSSSQKVIECLESSLELFKEYFSTSENAKKMILQNSACIDCLFELFWENRLRERLLDHILELLKLPPSYADRSALLYLCSKFLETFTCGKENRDFLELSIDLLIGMRDVLLIDQRFYQDLFRDGECFLHVVSLLNGMADDMIGEQLVLNVLQTLTLLLSGNDNSKSSFRTLVGVGYQTLQSLLLDYCRPGPSLGILSSLLDMLVDGSFDTMEISLIKNKDVIMLFLSVLKKSSDSLRGYGVDVFLELLKDSITNRDLCFRAGMLSFLLDWFSTEENDDILANLVQLIQLIGGHSMSGKDIRKIFAILRSEKTGSSQMHRSLMLSSILSMLKETGPAAFFEFSGHDSGILIDTAIQWPLNKGFTFSCWIRVEGCLETGLMGLFNFQTENGRGCSAMLGKHKLVFESVNQKRQSVTMPVNLFQRKWHFLCVVHSIGRAFSGGSILRCYVDGDLVSSEKCRYAKITDVLTCCAIGARIPYRDEQGTVAMEESSPFFGQIGPIYTFCDSLSSEQIKKLFSLGPSYMYSFVGNEFHGSSDNSNPNVLLDAKDGLSSKIIFGLSAQASDGSKLFNVSPIPGIISDRTSFQATVMSETRLCSRRILQEIIYCVGGVSVFFPLLTRLDSCETFNKEYDYMLMRPIANDKIAAQVVELIASVLDQNPANQHQMHLLSGFSIMGFLFRSLPPQQLNMDTIVSLKYLLDTVGSCDFLVKEAVAQIYLNPHIWIYVGYEVQRELYMLLIQHFEGNFRQLTELCSLPQIMDIIRQFYWDRAEPSVAFGVKPLLHPSTGQAIAERPSPKDIHKIRLLLLSLSEMSLKQKIEASDVKALLAFFEKSQDMVCIEDILQMVMRVISQTPTLASFLEQVNLLGGCHIFLNLLQRDSEAIRLLGLQFLGKLLVGVPFEKKSQKFFNLSVGLPKSLFENYKKDGFAIMQPIYAAMSERLFKFTLSDHLCATLFDVLLGGASPKQVLQKHTSFEKHNVKKNSSVFSSQFALPQILVLIFNFLSRCDDSLTRGKILNDVLNLLDSNSSNIESLMEYGWHSWLATSVELGAKKSLKMDLEVHDKNSIENEQLLVRNVYSIVLSHYIYSVKGGWQQLEDTVDFLLVNYEQGKHLKGGLLQNIFKDLVKNLLEISSEENIFLSQPCRDNSLYLLKLIDEKLINEIDDKLIFPKCIAYYELSSDIYPAENDIRRSIDEILNDKGACEVQSRTLWSSRTDLGEYGPVDEDQWIFYDSVWVLICELNGKGPSKKMSKASSVAGPSFGQRARGLVESLNIPAAEMAAVVVSGGIGSALGGKTTKYVDKAMILRGEKCPRIIFRLLILYLYDASLERASTSVHHFVSLLPCLISLDDEQHKKRLQLFIWSALAVRTCDTLPDNDARFDIISHLIVEMVNYGKAIFAALTMDKDDSSDLRSIVVDAQLLNSLIEKDSVLSVAAEEVKYIKSLRTDRLRHLEELHSKMDDSLVMDSNQKKMLEDEIKSSVSTILSSDDNRRIIYQIAYDEDQQIVAEKWVHIFRTLVDERGPWSAAAFPNNKIVHWKHDKTEDNWRRRPKLRRNYHFDEKLCYPPAAPTCKEAINRIDDRSLSMKSFPEQMKLFLLKGVRGIADDGNSEQCEYNSDQVDVHNDFYGQSATLGENHKEQTDTVRDRSSLHYVAEPETSKVLLSIPCVLVTPKRKLAGYFTVREKFLHFSGEFLVEGTGGLSIFKKFQNLGNFDTSVSGVKSQNFLKGSLNQDGATEKNSFTSSNMEHELMLQTRNKKIKRHRRWKITKVKSVHWTRYLLQYTAIEIFFSNSVAPVFFNFATPKEAKNIGALVVSSRNEALFPKGGSKNRSGLISFIDRRVALEMAESARESWRRREISNFEYLMTLNTLAGRSYNDITQYPVFPWIIADYASEKLDFNKSSTFRDLSKPVGALDSKRFEVFEDRYHNFSDPDIPSFYYGSHYSSMGIVLYYLIRLEPFTALHRNLQGGKFDHADRLFQSIEGTYRNCMSNTSDVKELTPEFFYMPEFLVNSNSYHLGVKQDGEPLRDVSLPPWAKGSPEEFISRNREALESEFVSSNLHDWIDLVFGYKQRGKPAVEAANVFYYLTYEGAVDLESMDDELQRSAIEDQIANFGQTPIQIFRKKHPRRGPPIPIAHPLHFAPASISLTSIVSNMAPPSSSILFISLLDSNIVIMNEGLCLTVKTWLTTQLQSGGNFTFSSSQDPFFGIGSDLFPPRKIGVPVADSIELGKECFATLRTAGESYLISCGSWDNSFQVISINDGRTVRSIRQHKDVVSCIAVTSDGSAIVTGSYDTTVMVWDVSCLMGVEKRMLNVQNELLSRDSMAVENPFHILCGHDDIITCLSVSLELDVIISGSKDGTCIFHTLREGRYVRSIQHPSCCPLSKLVVSQHGRVVMYAENDLSLHMFSVNGKHLAFSECNGRLNCIELSCCGDFLVCGGDNGQIVLRSMHSLEIVRRYEGIGRTVTSLAVTPEECFLAGTRDGSILLYSIEKPLLRKASLPRNTKLKVPVIG